MGILSRFINVVRANLNALLTRAEDPARLLEQALADMEGAYRKAKDRVAHSVADAKRLEQALAEQRGEAARWERRAVQAVESGDDELAREALRRKQEHTRHAATYEHEIAAHATHVERLKESLRELETKIADIRRRKGVLLSRHRRAEAQDEIYRTIEGIDATGAVATIERMEHRIEELSALADARQQVSREFAGDRVEQRFAELEAGTDDVDAELLELKQRLQIEHTEGG